MHANTLKVVGTKQLHRKMKEKETVMETEGSVGEGVSNPDHLTSKHVLLQVTLWLLNTP